MMNNKGFTLIETVVSMVIAGIILGVIYYAFSMSMRITNSGNNVLKATDLAKSVYYKFSEKRKKNLFFIEDYKEDGELADGWHYLATVEKLSVNVNDKFDVDINKCYKFNLLLNKDKKDYNFEFYFEK